MRLIDADALMETVFNDVVLVDGEVKGVGLILAETVDSAPAADVAPVVHGHWKKDRDTIKCTVCGFGMFPNRYTFMHGVCVTDNKLPKYCENCGAKMGTTEEQSV
jgi:hypothetical protein